MDMISANFIIHQGDPYLILTKLYLLALFFSVFFTLQANTPQEKILLMNLKSLRTPWSSLYYLRKKPYSTLSFTDPVLHTDLATVSPQVAIIGSISRFLVTSSPRLTPPFSLFSSSHNSILFWSKNIPFKLHGLLNSFPCQQLNESYAEISYSHSVNQWIK